MFKNRNPRPVLDGILHRLAAALIALALPFGASAGERYMGIILPSIHVGDDDLNDMTVGLTLGRRWSAGWTGGEYFVEGGFFYNSYNETGPLLMAGVSQGVARIGTAELRLGGFAGLAHYDELSETLQRDFNIPTLGPIVPIVGLSGSLRQGPHEIRVVTVPAADSVKAILNLSYARRF